MKLGSPNAHWGSWALGEFGQLLKLNTLRQLFLLLVVEASGPHFKNKLDNVEDSPNNTLQGWFWGFKVRTVIFQAPGSITVITIIYYPQALEGAIKIWTPVSIPNSYVTLGKL